MSWLKMPAIVTDVRDHLQWSSTFFKFKQDESKLVEVTAAGGSRCKVHLQGSMSVLKDQILQTAW